MHSTNNCRYITVTRISKIKSLSYLKSSTRKEIIFQDLNSVINFNFVKVIRSPTNIYGLAHNSLQKLNIQYLFIARLLSWGILHCNLIVKHKPEKWFDTHNSILVKITKFGRSILSLSYHNNIVYRM